MTGLTDTEHAVKALEAGGVDYVTKPIVADVLVARMRVHLANARLAQAAHVALDAAGRYLLAVDDDARVLWCTPQAGKLLNDALVASGAGRVVLPGATRDRAIEMAGWLHLKVDIIKDGMRKYGIKNPIFKPSPITPTYNDYLIFEGISVDEQGKQYYLDGHIAYRQACLNAIEYLTKFGYSKAQAYAILGTAPVQGHISGVIDIPKPCATLWLPPDIFEFDVMPSASGPVKHIQGGVDIPLSPDK